MHKVNVIVEENNRLREENNALREALNAWNKYTSCYPNCSFEQWDACISKTQETMVKYPPKVV